LVADTLGNEVYIIGSVFYAGCMYVQSGKVAEKPVRGSCSNRSVLLAWLLAKDASLTLACTVDTARAKKKKLICSSHIRQDDVEIVVSTLPPQTSH